MKTINQFIAEYGEYIRFYKVYDNGVIHVKFDDSDRIMWLKGVICEELNMRVKTATAGRSYWFEPA